MKYYSIWPVCLMVKITKSSPTIWENILVGTFFKHPRLSKSKDYHPLPKNIHSQKNPGEYIANPRSQVKIYTLVFQIPWVCRCLDPQTPTEARPLDPSTQGIWMILED